MKSLLPIMIILSMALWSQGTAQPHHFRGTVRDAYTRQPLSGANVFIKHQNVGTTTDSLGRFYFILDNPQLRDTLIIQFVGYRSLQIPLSQWKNNHEWFLTPRAIPGQSVTVQSSPGNIARNDIAVARATIAYRQIESYGSSEIADIFKLIPAVQISGNDLDGRRIEIRGSNADEVNVYVDGILINQLGLNYAADLSIIPVETIGHLEVLKGSNLTLTGSGAFGGVVAITTRRPGTFQASVQFKTGSFNNRYGFGRLQIPLGKKVFLNYSGLYQEYRPTIEYYPEDRFAALDTNRNIFTRKTNHQLNLFAFGKHTQWQMKVWNYGLHYTKPGWRNTRTTWLAALSFKGNLLGSREWEIQLSTNWNTDALSRLTTQNNRVRSNLSGKQAHLRVLKGVSFGRGNGAHFLTEYFHDELTIRETLETPQQHIPMRDWLLYDNRAAIGAVIHFENWVNNDSNRVWSTDIGGRYEVQASGRSYVTNQMSIRYAITTKGRVWTPYFNFGNNVKLPYLMENAFATYLSTQATGFRQLEPEINDGAEVGLEVTGTSRSGWGSEWKATLALFKNTTTNKLLRQVGNAAEVYYQTGRNVTRGGEIAVALQGIGRYWEIRGGWLWLNISDRRFYPYKPDQRATLEIRMAPWHGFYFSIVGFYEGWSTAWFVDRSGSFQTVTIAPFRDMDIVLGWQKRLGHVGIHVQLAGYNILDASGYRQYLLKKQFFQASLRLWYE